MRHYERNGRQITVIAEDPTGAWAMTVIVPRQVAEQVLDHFVTQRAGKGEVIELCRRYGGRVVGGIVSDESPNDAVVLRDAGLALLGGDRRFLNSLEPDTIGPFILEEVEASVEEMEGVFTSDTDDEALAVVAALGALLCSLAASHGWSMPMDDDRFIQRFQDELSRRCSENPALEAAVVSELRNWAGDRPLPSIDGWADRLRLR